MDKVGSFDRSARIKGPESTETIEKADSVNDPMYENVSFASHHKIRLSLHCKQRVFQTETGMWLSGLAKAVHRGWWRTLIIA